MNYYDSSNDLGAYFASRLEAALRELAQVDPDYLLSENAEVLLTAITQRHIPSPVTVDWEGVSRSKVQETSTLVRDQFFDDRIYDVPASKVTLTFPLTGDAELLKRRASTFTASGTQGEILPTAVRLDIVERQLDADAIKTQIASLRQHIDIRAGWANNDLTNWERQAHETLRRDYETRKARVLSDRAVEEALGIPVQATKTAKAPVPAQRKHITFETRRDQKKFVPEPELTEAIYRDVLDQTQSWTRAMERTPGTLAKLDEEELRDLLLAHLNAYWQGEAGGELFNGQGKTDILIRHGDRNVFIAECKIWGGPKVAADAIDQLLRYLVWRDSKAALIMFIRTKDPAATIARLHETLAAHSKHVLTRPGGDASRQRDYIFTADDEGRRISLAALPVVQSFAV